MNGYMRVIFKIITFKAILFFPLVTFLPLVYVLAFIAYLIPRAQDSLQYNSIYRYNILLHLLKTQLNKMEAFTMVLSGSFWKHTFHKRVLLYKEIWKDLSSTGPKHSISEPGI